MDRWMGKEEYSKGRGERGREEGREMGSQIKATLSYPILLKSTLQDSVGCSRSPSCRLQHINSAQSKSDRKKSFNDDRNVITLRNLPPPVLP